MEYTFTILIGITVRVVIALTVAAAFLFTI